MRSRVDIAIALTVAIVGQLDVWATDLTGANVVGPRPLVAAFYLVTALSLAGRRRAPLAVAMVVVGANVVQALALGASEGPGVLVPGLIALYSVGAHEDRPRSLIPLAGLVAIVLARETNNPDNADLRDLLDALAWESTIFAAWLLGAYLRTRRLYVAELEERAIRAERAREEQARAAVADERRRIARELHDAVAHGVTVMVVQAEAADEILGRDPERVRQALRKVHQTGREALVELRRLLGVLRDEDVKPERGPQPGLADLDTLVAAVEEAGLPVELRVEGAPVVLPGGLDLSAYRIVQESLTNTLKHAGPTSATVVLTYGDGILEVEISDEGLGPRPSNGAGHGLTGMRERVALFGGELESGPRPGRGYLVRARLPVRT